MLHALLAAALSALACAWLAPRALRWGLRDGPDAAAAGARARKLQRAPVALVGGLAIACALLAVHALPFAAHAPPWWIAESGAAALALALALGAGLADDLAPRGLGPLAKLALQSLAALPLAYAALEPSADVLGLELAWQRALTAWCATLLALNLMNTYDHADGMAGGVAALGLCSAWPIAAGACAGFLPFNFERAAASPAREPSAPRAAPRRAFLGDAGSHLLGMLVLLVPAAWPCLFVPALDLVRVACARLCAGEPPWRGDRRHLGQRLAARGLTPLRAACAALALAAPALYVPGWLGYACSAGAYALALAWSARPAVVPRGAPPP